MRTVPRYKAFTLIELLTVIAITAILMTFIIVPVVQSFNMLRAGQGWSEAQERGRIVVNQISTEIGNAISIRDNSGRLGAIGIVLPAANGLGAQGTDPDRDIEILMPYTKVDIVKPAEGEPEVGPNGGFINPLTGKEDPTQLTPRGQVVLPAVSGATYVRYFIGLRNPVDPNPANPGLFIDTGYNNPYDGTLMARNAQGDNLYVLYRVEYQPFVWSANLNRYVVNTKLFLDQNNDNVPDDFDDPYFFTFRPVTAGAAVTDYDVNFPPKRPLLVGDPVRGQSKALRITNWLKRATVVTNVNRYDMIQPVVDPGRLLAYNGIAQSPVVRDANGIPEIMPLVQFRPTRITSETPEAMNAVRQGEESEGMSSFGPGVYESRYAAWTSQLIRMWPTGWVPGNAALNSYMVGRADPAAADAFKLYSYDPDLGGTENTSGVELFNVTQYLYSIAQGQRYAFTAAANAGNLTGAARDLFTPYYIDKRAGRIIAEFPISDIGNAAINPPPNNPNNLPAKDTGPEVVPATEVTSPGNFYDPQYGSINRQFNWVWNNWPQLRPNIHRFIDLRVTQNEDGTNGPLHPDPALGYARARMVPGSERVFGPDQHPGPNYGSMTEYTRTTRNPGPNQYRVNYVDIREPDYAALGLANPPAVYNSQDFMSAIYQPRFKAGYIQLNSDPNVPLPTGEMQVYYKFQMTQPGDVFAVDYDTRELVSVLLTIRNYPQTTLPSPQTITLRASSKVRNFLR